MSNERDCKNCQHYVLITTRVDWRGLANPTSFFSCEKWECEYLPKGECEHMGADGSCNSDDPCIHQIGKFKEHCDMYEEKK